VEAELNSAGRCFENLVQSKSTANMERSAEANHVEVRAAAGAAVGAAV